MAETVSQINTASDTFQVWIDRTNELANLVSTKVLTSNSDANGSITSGNVYLNGSLATTTLATPTLRGGNNQTAANLSITSNVNFSGTWANVIGLYVNSTVVNSTTNASFYTGNLVFGPSSISLGNSTVNVSINSTMFRIGSANLITESQRASIANVGTLIGTRKTLNFIANGNIQMNITDDSGGNQVNVEITTTSNVSVDGANTTIQFNDSGSFGGSNAFTFNSASNTVQIGNSLVVSNSFTLGNTVFNQYVSYTSSNTDPQIIDSFFIADHRTVEYTASIKHNTANGYQSQKILVLQADGGTNVTSYAILRSNGSLGTFDANSNSTHIRLTFTPTNANTTVKLNKIMIGV